MCVEPNDAERHSLHETDAEISELESEILAVKVKMKCNHSFFKEY